MSAFPVKRPGWFLRFYVRLEDFTNPLDDDAQPEDQPFNPAGTGIDQLSAAETQVAIGRAAAAVVNSQNKQVQAQKQTEIAQLRRHQTALKTKSAAGDQSKGDDFSIEFATVPLSLEIEDKGFRFAATLTAEFPFVDLPLDPCIVRECRVEAWIGTIPAADFATRDKWRLSPIPSATTVLRFNGYIDLDEMTHSDTEGTVHIKARSYEAVLIDGKINSMASAYRIKGDKEAITTYVNRILSQYPPTAGQTGGDSFKAYWYGDPTKEPLLNRKTLVRSLQTAQSRNAANGSTGNTKPTTQADKENDTTDAPGTGDSAEGGSPAVTPGAMKEDGISIWDLITQACELCGCIPMYRPTLPNPTTASCDGPTMFPVQVDPANCLLLVPPEAFFDDIQHGTTIVGGARDGFQRTLTTSDGTCFDSDVRFMVWGHNIKSMKLSRKFSRARPTAVEVRSYNPDADSTLRVMSSRFPPVTHKAKKGKGTRHTKMTEKGHGKIDVVRTFILKGTRDQLALDQAAVSIYHQLCRPELSVELDTDELSSYFDAQASYQNNTLVSSDNLDPDLFRLCPGTPVHVAVARKQDTGGLVISSLSEFYDRKGQHTEAMVRQAAARWGYQVSDDKLDIAIARIQKAYETAKLPEVFYCRTVHLKFTAETDFFSMKIELVSYLDAMNDPAQISTEAQELNDARKKRKLSALAKKKVAETTETTKVIEKVQRDNLPPAVSPTLVPSRSRNPYETGTGTGT